MANHINVEAILMKTIKYDIISIGLELWPLWSNHQPHLKCFLFICFQDLIQNMVCKSQEELQNKEITKEDLK